MLSCWRTHPESRPSFQQLSSFIRDIFGENRADYYVDMNEPYLKSNTGAFNEGRTDYLTMIARSDYCAPTLQIVASQD